MLTIPAAVQTLLKSKVMVGDNRPTGQVLVQDAPGRIDFDSLGNTTYDPLGTPLSDTNHASSCELADGRVLVVWCDGDKIRQGYAGTVDALFADASVGTVTDILSGLEKPVSIICDLGDDGLYLLVSYIQQNSDSVAKSLLYKSASGNGGDWTLYATLQSFDWTGASTLWYGDVTNTITGILRTTGGSYICQVPYYLIIGTYGIVSHFGIYSSADLASWTKKQNLVYGLGSRGYHEGASSNFVEVDGAVYVAFYDWYGGVNMNLIKSIDYFETQSTVFKIDTDVLPYYNIFPYSSCTFHVQDGKLFVVGVQIISERERLFICACDLADLEYAEKYYLANASSVGSFPVNGGYNRASFLEITSSGQVVFWGADRILGMEGSVGLPVKSITVDRSKGSASMATVALDNKDGQYSPDSTGEWNKIIWLNKTITITMGYGAAQQLVFTGLIDEIMETNYPAELTVVARDLAKRALDQQPQATVGEATVYALLYESKTPEEIFAELALLAGWAAGDIHVGITGVTISSIQFGHESIADCFQRLCELVCWEWFVDESGDVYFQASTDPAAATVYEFIEGVDIFSISYRISDIDLYRNIVVWTSDEDGLAVKATEVWSAADYNNLLPYKTLIINAGDLVTDAAGCAAIAAAEANAITPKVREVNFVAVGNPYLQIGDVIQVTESTTHASELYRIMELMHQMEAAAEGVPVFSTSIRCYHYGPAA